MTVERYNTPNHPRWDSETTDRPTRTTNQRRYGREYPRRDGAGRVPRSDPPMLSRDVTDDDTTIELRDISNRVWITTDLPDCSIDDVRVSVSGSSIRIRAESPEESPRNKDLDRTIRLAETVDPVDVVILYDEPALTVIVPQ